MVLHREAFQDKRPTFRTPNETAENVETIEGDAFEALKALADEKEKFDVVVLDPPALIPRRRDQKAGEEAYARLNQLGLRLLTARMTLDQSAAQAVFRRLGFQREAVLWDYAITPDGKTRNVLVATKRL